MLKGASFWTPELDPRQVYCMASTVYGEARGAGVLDQQKVASVVMNRVNATGRTVCSVVKQRAQFQGYGKPIRNLQAWEMAVEISIHTMSGLLTDFTYGATHFVEPSVSPRWAREMQITDASGVHVFYRSAK